MTSVAQWSVCARLLLLLLVLPTLSLWLFLQKGCMPDREIRPGTAAFVVILAVQDDAGLYRLASVVPINIKDEKRAESSGTPSQSLRYASILLSRAADALETNEILAVQLIRQVISILKHHVIPSLVEPDAALVPIDSP
jgi:hypothetical protein